MRGLSDGGLEAAILTLCVALFAATVGAFYLGIVLEETCDELGSLRTILRLRQYTQPIPKASVGAAPSAPKSETAEVRSSENHAE